MYRHPVNPTKYVSQPLTKLRNYVSSVPVQYHWPTSMAREWSCQVKQQAPPCSQLAQSPCFFVACGIGWSELPAKSFTSALLETTWVAMQVQTKRVTSVDNQKTRLPICGHHLQISLYRVGKGWKRVKKIKHLLQLSVPPQWLHYLVGWFMNDSSPPCQQTRNPNQHNSFSSHQNIEHAFWWPQLARFSPPSSRSQPPLSAVRISSLRLELWS